jgi:hypothetical protein
MSFGRSRQVPKPLSSKAASLLADLKAGAPQRESQYIGGLVQAAEKRKQASELAFERKLANEEGSASMSFVTKAYEEKLDRIGDERVAPLLRGAERVDASKELGKQKPWRESASMSTNIKAVDPEELIRRREARRLARKAPASMVTDELIEEARSRARQRLGI